VLKKTDFLLIVGTKREQRERDHNPWQRGVHDLRGGSRREVVVL